MAESILYDIAGEIILKLGSRFLQEVALWWGVNDEIKKLKKTVSRIQAVLLDAEEQQVWNHQVKDWIGKLKEVVFDADDLLDDFSTEALRRRVMDGNRMTKEVRVFFSRSNQFTYGLKMGHKIKAIRERLDDIYSDKDKLNLEVRLSEKGVMSRLRDQTNSSIPEVVVGREGDKKEIIGLLLGSNYDESVSVISIVGIGGLGKTTLAQVIFNDDRVKDHFELRLWVCVSDPFDVKVIVKKSLESATDSKIEDLELNTLKNRLEKCLNRKKFLLVLDDVWNEDSEKWDSLKRLLVSGASGSKIIVTTRSQKVAAITSTLSSHVLEGLSQSESWSLLVQIVFKGKEPRNEHVIEIGNEIVKKCVGVPLAIKTIGRLLSFKNPETEWLPFMENELSKVAQNEHDILPTLRLSYDYLPSHLKHCFAYCRLFPKDYEIDVKTLIHMWIGQGFVKSSDSSQCPEDIALEYFMELLWRSFFQELGGDIFGNIKSCKMHDLMHDLAILVSGTESNIIDLNVKDMDEKMRHVSCEFVLDLPWKVPTCLPKAKRLRTFLLSNQASILGDGGKWEESSNKFIFSKFKCLRVFELHNLGIEKVSSSIKRSKHLRYFDLSKNNGIKTLPNSITMLQNLQVLNLSGCKNLKELPKEIRKLINLRHLDCEECWDLTHMPSGIGQLTSLQTLTWFVVAKDSSVSKHIGSLNELNRLNDLRGRLEIRNLGYVKTGALEFEDANLREKQYLQSLILSWNKDVDNNSVYAKLDERPSQSLHDSNADVGYAYDERLLQNLQPHPNLYGLRVYEYGGVRFSSWISSLTNLVEIWIVNCKRCQNLPSLDQLPSLRELWISELNDLEYIDIAETYSLTGQGRQSKFFPSLKKLWIWKCPNLKGWRKKRDGNDDFAIASTIDSSLSLLELRSCPGLTWVPLIPYVNGKLFLENASLEPLEQTMKMNIMPTQLEGKGFVSQLSSHMNLVAIWLKDCKGCQHFPPLDQIHSLRDLYFDNLIDLEYISSVGDNSLTGGGTFFPSLKKLWIWNCPNLKGWQKQVDDDATTTTDGKLPWFPCLSLLEIKNCPKLTWMPLFPTLDDRLYYVNAGIQPLQQTMKMKMMSAPHEDLKFLNSTSSLANLQEFWISDLVDLEYVDGGEESSCLREGGSTVFPFLKKLWIYNCPILKGWWKKTDGNEDKTTMITVDLPHFPCLSLLEIKHCPQLTCMPLFPFLDQRLYYVNVGLEPLQQTMKMKMKSAQYGDVRFPSTTSSLTKLKELWLSDLTNLEYIDDEDICLSEEGLTVFPFLKKLWIYNCPNLKGWWKKRVDDTAPTTTELPQFPCLSLMEIKHCPKLSWMPLFPSLDERLYYVNAGIEPLLQTMKIKTMSEGAQLLNGVSSFKNLKELWLSELTDLEYIDVEGYGCFNGEHRESIVFPSLKKLWIDYCPNLKGWWKKRDDDTITTTTADLPQFPCLSLLEIKHCPNLSLMPLFPSLDERLYYVNARIEPLQQTMKVKTVPVQLEGVKLSSSVSPFTNLAELWISDLTDLDYLVCEVVDCFSGGARGSTVFFPSLKKLWIYNCPNLIGWWKKGDNGGTTTTAIDFPQFPCLSLLEIKYCPKLTWMPLFPSLDDELRLEGASIEPLEQTMKMKITSSSSLVRPLSKLKVLRIMAIEDLEYLPKMWLQNLTFLQELYIKECPRLTSLPREIHHLTSLQKLHISGCPLLSERCRNNDGVDWPNIADIPNIETDW